MSNNGLGKSIKILHMLLENTKNSRIIYVCITMYDEIPKTGHFRQLL